VGYKSFEDLPVWNAAIDLSARLFELTASGGLNGYAGLRDQIERATVSISNNIAEGFDRGTHAELLTFLYYALGSAGEVRSMLLLIRRLPNTQELHSDVTELIPLALSISRQLGAWIESLKNSDGLGPRFQNDSTRAASRTAERREDFLEKLERIKARARNTPDQSLEGS
jgi:four helix bundle protein